MEIKTWLKNIKDSTLLRKLTIIGTNDSCSFHYSNSLLRGIYRTQSKTLREQLELGARYLDITLTSMEKECYVKCGNKILDFNTYLLKECVSFLNENPSEFIIVNIRADYTTTKVFLREFKDLQAQSSRFIMNTNSNITVGELRNKIIFMNVIDSNEYIENMRCRVNYNHDLPSSDNGCIKKYTEIVTFDLESQEQDERLYVNYTHTNGYVCKYIPFPKISANKINDMIIKGYTSLKMKDIVLVVDFINEKLSKVVLKNNFVN